MPSFLLTSQSQSHSHSHSQLDDHHPSKRRKTETQPLIETQDLPESQSYNIDSNASSIGRFPSFHFSLHRLSTLGGLCRRPVPASASNLPSNMDARYAAQKQENFSSMHGRPTNLKPVIIKNLSLLLAILELEGPDTITIKRGPDAGQQVSILKLILGDEEGEVARLTAWREVAELWGGSVVEEGVEGVKRGDVVFLENVTATISLASSTGPPANPPNPRPNSNQYPHPPNTTNTITTLTASPYLNPRLTICYRTMPYTHEDGRLRPDLRLGASEPCVRKVEEVVRWFEGMAGLR